MPRFLCLTVVLLSGIARAGTVGPLDVYCITMPGVGLGAISGTSYEADPDWSAQFLSGLSLDTAIAVLNGDIVTLNPYLGGVVAGVNYGYGPTVDGNSVGDGATDNTYNYTIDFQGRVWRSDTLWRNPAQIFALTGVYFGITYDPYNNSLWLGRDDTGRIEDYDLSGNLLSSFSTGVSNMTALAMDYGDFSLWFIDNDASVMYQYSTGGTLLQSLSFPGGPGSASGGEFDISTVVPLPEPGTGGLFLAAGLALGIAGLRPALFHSRRNDNQ